MQLSFSQVIRGIDCSLMGGACVGTVTGALIAGFGGASAAGPIMAIVAGTVAIIRDIANPKFTTAHKAWRVFFDIMILGGGITATVGAFTGNPILLGVGLGLMGLGLIGRITCVVANNFYGVGKKI